MTDNEDINTLISELQRSTALGRIGHGELKAAFERVAELGYIITAPDKPISSRQDTP
jgi:hypothetical protein